MTTIDKTWVLITGASSGFGKEFACQYAEQGFSLILVARRLDPASKTRRGAIRALQAGRISVVPGWANKAAVIFTRATPRRLHQAIFSRIMNG